tara:strand:+ start:298 stop:657 length:360 start_codon:yes stop_codon:yes gene_type:complete
MNEGKWETDWCKMPKGDIIAIDDLQMELIEILRVETDENGKWEGIRKKFNTDDFSVQYRCDFTVGDRGFVIEGNKIAGQRELRYSMLLENEDVILEDFEDHEELAKGFRIWLDDNLICR